MDKWKWLDSFWNRFGWTAYENVAPDNAELPYIIYTGAVSDFDHPVSQTATLWSRGPSWAQVKQKANEIARTLQNERGTTVEIDDGRVRYWVGETPFAQPMVDQDDPNILGIVINFMVEYLTAY